MKKEEKIFLESIDCNFPYEDKASAEELIKKAASISDEALFGVLIEIVRLPKSASDKKDMQQDLVRFWEQISQSKLGIELLPLVKKKIAGEFISVSSILENLDVIRPHKNSYSALNLISSFVYDDAIEEKYDEISMEWSGLE